MGLFGIFRRKGEDPLDRYEDAVLGPMVWSDDDDAWQGEHTGVRYLIAYDREAAPTPETLAYAREILTDYHLFESAIRWAKRDAIARLPWLAEEIEGLRVECIHFHAKQDGRWIMADLAGGTDGRAWRAEFRGWDCQGIGFDT